MSDVFKASLHDQHRPPQHAFRTHLESKVCNTLCGCCRFTLQACVTYVVLYWVVVGRKILAIRVDLMAEEEVKISVRWNGNEYEVAIKPVDTLASLKRKIEEQTQVQPKRQKLLGIKVKPPLDDNLAIKDLNLKPGAKLIMMGTVDREIEQLQQQALAAPEVQDDFDLQEGQMKEVELKDRDEIKEKLHRRLQRKMELLCAPRPGKKCLVLDIDYTLFDLSSSAEKADELARPYLHEFLARAHQHYDIIIWSATSMKWVEVKMRELGCLDNARYNIVCLMDGSSMLTVHTQQYGVFNCKPLAVIWQHPVFEGHYTEDNTIMFDDLRRNYILNPQQGLVIRPFKHAHKTRTKDRELLKLTLYLEHIAPLPSLSHLDHSQWEAAIAEQWKQYQRQHLQ